MSTPPPVILHPTSADSETIFNHPDAWCRPRRPFGRAAFGPSLNTAFKSDFAAISDAHADRLCLDPRVSIGIEMVLLKW